MSLQGSVEVSAVAHSGPLQRPNVDNAKVNERKGNNQIPEDTGRKRKKSVCYLKQRCFSFLLLFLADCPILVVFFDLCSAVC